jgi:hypothetical protein
MYFSELDVKIVFRLIFDSEINSFSLFVYES